MIGLSTSGSISFGCALVAGRNLVPRPAAGKTAFRTLDATTESYNDQMLDPAFVRDNVEAVRTGLRNRGMDPDKTLEDIITLETARRRLIPELEGLKRQQNTSGDEIARAKRQGKDTAHIQEANKQRAGQIKQMEVQLGSVEHQREVALLNLPNLPHSSVPVGKSAADNVEVRRVGEPRFSVLSRQGARLSRALINFMLDIHTREHGYVEVEPPFMVNTAALLGTGNLPKFEEIGRAS